MSTISDHSHKHLLTPMSSMFLGSLSILELEGTSQKHLHLLHHGTDGDTDKFSKQVPSKTKVKMQISLLTQKSSIIPSLFLFL